MKRPDTEVSFLYSESISSMTGRNRVHIRELARAETPDSRLQALENRLASVKEGDEYVTFPGKLLKYLATYLCSYWQSSCLEVLLSVLDRSYCKSKKEGLKKMKMV